MQPELHQRNLWRVQPYYFNHCWESNPATLFYDGHTETVGTRKAERADGRVQAQSGVGLWCRSTPWGLDGYNIGAGYDFANTGFHVLTTQGIKVGTFLRTDVPSRQRRASSFSS